MEISTRAGAEGNRLDSIQHQDGIKRRQLLDVLFIARFGIILKGSPVQSSYLLVVYQPPDVVLLPVKCILVELGSSISEDG